MNRDWNIPVWIITILVIGCIANGVRATYWESRARTAEERASIRWRESLDQLDDDLDTPVLREIRANLRAIDREIARFQADR